MPKNSLTDYSATNASNTDVGGINIDEGCLPSSINDAIREVMTHLKEFEDGTSGITKLSATDAEITGTGAIKVPVGTTAQRPTPAQGQIRYNTTDSSFEGYDGSAWGAIGGGSENSFIVYEYTATASQTTFSGADDNAATLSYTAGNIQVMLNGVVLDPSDYTATNGTSVVLASGATLNDVLNVYAFTSFTVADTVPASTGGTFSANVAVTGTVTADEFVADSAGTLGNDQIMLDFSAPAGRLRVKNSSGSPAANMDFYTTDTGGNTRIRQRVSYGGDISFYDSTGVTQGLFWDASTQRLGLGATSPSDILHIKDSASTNVLIDAPTDNASLTLQCGSSDAGAEGAFVNFIQNTTSKWQMGMNTDNSFRWYNYNTSSEAMQIDSSGNLLVGTTAANGNGVTISGTQGNNFWLSKANTTTAYNQLAFHNPNGSVGTIQTSGTSTSYNTSSDYRLKENVTADWDATTRLKQLNPVRFNFIADADTTVDGFLAHEVQDIVPEAITGAKDAMRDEEYEVTPSTGDIYTPAIPATFDEDGNEVTAAVDEVIHSSDVERPETLADGQEWRETTAAVMGTRSVPDYQGIDQSKLTPLLTKALIEAVDKIEELEARIAALENA